MNDSQQAGADVARTLGFDPKEFIEINLRFRAGELLVVDAQQFVIGDRLKKVADEIVKRKFVVREIEDDGPPVAVRAEQRHDAATCRGERHEPDVGEGWRWVKPGEILRDGDEYLPYWSRDDENPWREINCTGMSVGANEPRTYRRRVTPSNPVEIDGDRPDVGEGWRLLNVGEEVQDGDCRYQDQEWEPCCISLSRTVTEQQIAYGIYYRRRVTPAAQPIEITPAAISAMCQRNERDALFKRIENLKAENHEQQGKNLQACLENERLRSEVERLRLRPDELDAIEHGQALLLVVWQQNQQASGIFAEGKKASDVLLKLLKRLGGGE